MFGAQYFGQTEPASTPAVIILIAGGGWAKGDGVPLPRDRYSSYVRRNPRGPGMVRPPWSLLLTVLLPLTLLAMACGSAPLAPVPVALGPCVQVDTVVLVVDGTRYLELLTRCTPNG